MQTPIEKAIEELSVFLHKDQETIKNKISDEIEHPGSLVAKAWRKANPKTSSEVENFYKTTDAYLYNLSVESVQPTRIEWRDEILLYLTQYDNKKTMLDFGGGIGTEALYYRHASYDVAYHDLPGLTSDFARYRFNIYANDTIKSITRESATTYDVVISLEVLEHLNDPMGAMQFMYDHLNHGGLAFITQSFDLVSDDYPSHLEKNKQYAKNFEERLVDIGFTIMDKIAHGRILVLGKFGVVDVVVPTYNAYEYTKEAIESVRMNTKDTPYRFVFVNDQSTDPRIEKLFKQVARKSDIILTNEVNLGFVQTANRGLQASDTNDVVLLNTDTVTTMGWLSAIQTAIYQKNSIATANPLTNNASIYSIKELSDLRQTMSIQEIGTIIRNNSEKLYPDIPVSVGFCVYIKRRVMKEIGYLDEIFGRGYGEESDFCMRCRRAGYSHLLVDTAFVYHKGSVSMLLSGDIQEGKISIDEHEQILLDRYPDYVQNVQEFEERGTFRKIKYNVINSITRSLAMKRQKILYVLHEPITGPTIGGTELHAYDLVHGLNKEKAIYVMTIQKGNRIIIEEHVNDIYSTYAIDLPFALDTFSISNPYIYKTCQKILQVFNIDVVHIHHLINHTFDIIYAAKALAIPTVFSVHDYYLLSPDYTLSYRLTEEGRYSRNRFANNQYFFDKYGIKDLNNQEWQAEVSKFVSAITRFVYPSKIVQGEIESVYGVANKSNIITHGETLISEDKDLDRYQRASDSKFSVLFLGYTHIPQKGGTIVKEIIPKLLRKNIEVHLLGSRPEEWPEYHDSKKLICHGHYKRSDVVAILQQINPSVIVLASPWPETFSYTYSEALMAHIPVVAFNMGAVSERAAENQATLLVDDVSPKGLTRAVTQLAEDKKQYQALKKGAKNARVKTLEENVLEYSEIYNEVMEPHTERVKHESEDTIRAMAEVYLLDSELDVSKYKNSEHGSIVSHMNTHVAQLTLALGSEKAFADRVRRFLIYRIYKKARKVQKRILR